MELHRLANDHHCKTNSLHIVSKFVRKKQGQSHDTKTMQEYDTKIQEFYKAWTTFLENTF
jgi:hypothetical protein